MNNAFKLATERGGLFSLFGTDGNIPEYAIKDVIENGAVYTYNRKTVLYSYLKDKERLGLRNTRVRIRQFHSVLEMTGH